MILQTLVQLTWKEAFSGIFGSISLASWIFLLIPQLIENYKHKSADAVSLTFLLIWLAGDVANLAGALLAHLVPTVTAIAVYFCFADFVLITQCLYYRRLNKRKQRHDAERTPLLSDQTEARLQHKGFQRRLTDVTDENVGLPGSRRRSSMGAHHTNNRQNSWPSIAEKRGKANLLLKNTLSIIGVILVGAVGWAIAYKIGAWQPTPEKQEIVKSETPIAAEILGYASAMLYLGARIPQILKNQRERSCDGLSLLFFILSLMGNATYGAGILFHSVEKTYFLTNLPWLIGSMGTMVEDVAVFIQFSVFGEREPGPV